MPLLLTESLDATKRELTHQHIESCAACEEEWLATRETWAMLEELPEVKPPARLRERFLAEVLPAAQVEEKKVEERDNVVPFQRRPALKWIAQAAAVVILAGGSYFAGRQQRGPETPLTPIRTGATVDSVNVLPASLSIAESRNLQASAISPEIIGRPDIANVQFVDDDPTDGKIGVSFDITSRWTVTGSPNDKSMVRLFSYVLENGDSQSPRANAIDWVRRTYSDPQYAHNEEISAALAKVLRTDEHEGMRIRAVETLKTLPSSDSVETRAALIEALKSDPNPAVRIKAVEALAKLAASGATLDAAAVDTLREKASQDDENLYVRVKAAEALSNMRP